MDAFSYLSVLLSIILGLAITQLLQNLGRLIQARARVTLFWPPVILAGVMLISLVQSWWAMFGLRNHAGWTFGAFFVVILQTVFAYLQAALILPDFAGEAPVDLRANYYTQARWIFGSVIAGTLTSLAKDLVLDGHLPNRTNVAFHCFWIALSVIAMFVRRDWFHWWAALVGFIGVNAYIVLLFTRLQ